MDRPAGGAARARRRIAYGADRKWGGEYPVGPRVSPCSRPGDRSFARQHRWVDGRRGPCGPACPRGWAGTSTCPTNGTRSPPWCDGGCRRSGRAPSGTCGGGSAPRRGRSRTALRDVAAVEVDLDGAVGHLLPDDLGATPSVEPWAALLPGLDPTVMGWADRDWYLGPHGAELFDRNGNAGPTAWWDGRVVGGWHQTRRGRSSSTCSRAWTRWASGRSRSRPAAHPLAGRAGGHAAVRLAAEPTGPVRDGRDARRVVGCQNSPSSKPLRSSDCGSATPSAAGSASPATVTSRGRSSGRCSGRGSRWRTPPASTPTRGSPTPVPPDRVRERGGVPRDRAGAGRGPGRRPPRPRRGAAGRPRRPRGGGQQGRLARRPAGGEPLAVVLPGSRRTRRRTRWHGSSPPTRSRCSG